MLSLLAGLSVVLAARQQIRRGVAPWREPYLPGLILFESLVLVPVAGYFFFSQPAWSMLYLIGPTDLTTWSVFGILLGSVLTAAAGYWIGDALCRSGRNKLLVMVAVVVAAGVVVFLALAGDRLGRLSEDGNWKTAPSLFSTRLGTVFAFVIPLVLGGWVFLLVLFSVEGRRVRLATTGAAPSDVPAIPISTAPPVYSSSLESLEQKFYAGADAKPVGGDGKHPGEPPAGSKSLPGDKKKKTSSPKK